MNESLNELDEQTGDVVQQVRGELQGEPAGAAGQEPGGRRPGGSQVNSSINTVRPIILVQFLCIRNTVKVARLFEHII